MFRRWGLLVTLIVIWQGISAAQLVNPLLLPSPQSVLDVAVSAEEWKTLLIDLGSSCSRLVAGFLLGGLLGVSIGVVMGRSAVIYDTLEFLVDFSRSIPVAALFPLFIVFFGIGNASKIATTTWSTALIVLVQTMYGVRSSLGIRERFARTLGATRRQILFTIVLPEAAPAILGGLRTGLSIAIIVVIMTEMFLGTTVGLGQRIYNAALLYDAPNLYFTIALTGLVGYGLNQGFVRVERFLLAWNKDGN